MIRSIISGLSGLSGSNDLLNFVQITSSFGTSAIKGIAYGNGLFVAVGDSGKIATSPDGITWTQGTSSFDTSNINGIAYANSLFVAGGANGKIATSQYQG